MTTDKVLIPQAELDALEKLVSLVRVSEIMHCKCIVCPSIRKVLVKLDEVKGKFNEP